MTETITITTLDPHRIQPWHNVEDEAKLARLISAMSTMGWAGPPIVVINRDDADPIAINGSHRIAAAREVGIEVPAIGLDDLLHAHGTSLAEVDEETGSAPEDELHYETVTRLDYYLPAEVVAHYGLDAH